MFVTMKRYPTFAHDVFGNDFNKFCNTAFDTDRVASKSFSPAMDIAESENEYVLVLNVPGVKKEDVKLNVEDNVLTISGERKSHPLPEKTEWLRNEIRTGSFTRTVKLSKNVDAEKISAELNDGVLKVVLPKAEAAKPRTITIS
jgi:HSP20 family protein